MNRKNLLLIIALSLPILMILFVTLSVYTSSFFYSPQNNFLFSLDRQYRDDGYFVKDGKIGFKKTDEKAGISQLFFYDVKKDQSHSISFEEAQRFQLDPNPVSQDGFSVRTGGATSFFPFFYTHDNQVYLQGHNTSKKLNIVVYQNNYWGFHFIGWIVNDKSSR